MFHKIRNIFKPDEENKTKTTGHGTKASSSQSVDYVSPCPPVMRQVLSRIDDRLEMIDKRISILEKMSNKSAHYRKNQNRIKQCCEGGGIEEQVILVEQNVNFEASENT